MDGLTYSVIADTSTGHFEVNQYNPDAEIDDTMVPSHRSNSYDVDVDRGEKSKMWQKFNQFNL